MNRAMLTIIISTTQGSYFFGGNMQEERTTNISENEILYKEQKDYKERKDNDGQRTV